MDILRGKRRGLELSVEHSIPAVSTAPPGGRTDILRGKRQGYGALCCPPARSQEQGRSEAACVQRTAVCSAFGAPRLSDKINSHYMVETIVCFSLK